MGASDRRKLWICRFAWTTQTRCPHTRSSDRKKRRKRLEDSFEEEENRNGRRLYTLISTVPGPSDGVHLTDRSSPPFFCALDHLTVDDRGGGAGLAPLLRAAEFVKRIMHTPQLPAPAPGVEVAA